VNGKLTSLERIHKVLHDSFLKRFVIVQKCPPSSNDNSTLVENLQGPRFSAFRLEPHNVGAPRCAYSIAVYLFR
jgi:hypothetical protein